MGTPNDIHTLFREEISSGKIPGLASLQKFGHNFDIDSLSTPEDIWDIGGLYAFPSSAATTTIVSDDANDTAAGTGAQSVHVFGLNSNWEAINEIITLDGTTPVTLTNDYLRVFRAHTETVGSTDINEGNIQIKHGSTVLAQITAAYGQTLMAIYTVPKGFDLCLMDYYCSVQAVRSCATQIILQTRHNNGVNAGWRTRHTLGVTSEGSSYIDHNWDYGVCLPEKTDIRVRCTYSEANNAQLSAGFDCLLVDNSCISFP